jgi:predicted nucleic acid-binding protein
MPTEKLTDRVAALEHEVARLRRDLERLHAGEQECLFLCQHVRVSVPLTDDLAVREAAKHLHLTRVGSLGAIVRAYRVGHP